jgi:hypothetical protein
MFYPVDLGWILIGTAFILWTIALVMGLSGKE